MTIIETGITMEEVKADLLYIRDGLAGINRKLDGLIGDVAGIRTQLSANQGDPTALADAQRG